MEEKRNSYRLLVGKSRGKRLLGRPRQRCVKMNVEEREWGVVDWIGLVQDRDKWRVLENAIISLRIL
jgi:hypothetical protein